MTLPPIPPPDEAARQAAHARWCACAHPLGGLGLLEPLLEDLAALTGSPDLTLTPRTLLVLCADNGVVAQGISQCGPEVTAAGSATAPETSATAPETSAWAAP